MAARANTIIAGLSWPTAILMSRYGMPQAMPRRMNKPMPRRVIPLIVPRAKRPVYRRGTIAGCRCWSGGRETRAGRRGRHHVVVAGCDAR